MPDTSQVVRGRVVVRETHAGIADVVVVLLDVDPAWQPSAAAAFPQPARWQRLGSDVTARGGSFRLEYSPGNVLPESGEQVPRPDLVLVVLAPDDGAAAAGDPGFFGGRALLISEATRHDAGRSEAYVLRIPEAVLLEHTVPVPQVDADRGDVRRRANGLVEAVVARSVGEDDVRNGLRELRHAHSARSAERGARAARAVARLRKVSPDVQRIRSFAFDREETHSAQMALMSDGVERIGRRATHRDPMLVRIDDVHRLGISGDPDTVELDPETLCEVFAASRGGPGVERVVTVLDQRRKHERDSARLEDATSGEEPPEPEEPGEAGPSGDGLVRTAIRAQLADMLITEPERPASVEDLMARVTGFRLPPGPADVTAVHDFHELQIAFEHVWTEAFDRDVAGTVRDLYASVAELHEEFGVERELPEELAEMREVESFLRTVAQDASGIEDTPPADVERWLPDAAAAWHTFSPGQQMELLRIARDIERGQGWMVAAPEGVSEAERARLIHEARRRHDESLDALERQARAIMHQPRGAAGRALRLLGEVRERMKAPYAFHYFAPGSVNFGILVTYRQLWTPLGYQVGDLVATMPLAPGESRKVTARTTVKRSRAQKELERSLAVRRGESTEHRRAESEISERASLTTNFSTTATGSLTLGLGDISSTTEFSLNQAQESARNKKALREATVKAAEEYRQERSLEVTTSDVLTDERTTSGEVQNPNNEVTVTYLLYELERQFRVTGRVQRVTPTILVAQDVPAPDEITESWVLAYEWILRKVALTDLVHDALDELTSLAGDEIGLAIARARWEEQRRLAASLQADVETHRNARDRLREQLVEAERARGMAEAGESSTEEDIASAIFSGGLSLFAPDPSADAVERLEVARRAIEMELENRESTLQELEARLSRAADASSVAAREFEEGLRAQSARRARIDQCRIHVKENILYYMQAIWNHEPPDQRFFRLYHVNVTLPQPSGRCRLRPAEPDELRGPLPTVERDGRWWVVEECPPPAPFDPADPDLPVRRLVEVADLDRLLGFKGNYAIFPVKTCVYMSEFMVADFVDGYFGLRDPDPAADFTTEELLGYVESLWRDPHAELSDYDREALLALVRRRLREPRSDSDVVVVPTGQLYMDALIGSHPLLESFKLLHRGFDAAQARAQLRREELDNLRRAARLLAAEPLLDDPDVDRRIVVDTG